MTVLFAAGLYRLTIISQLHDEIRGAFSRSISKWGILHLISFHDFIQWKPNAMVSDHWSALLKQLLNFWKQSKQIDSKTSTYANAFGHSLGIVEVFWSWTERLAHSSKIGWKSVGDRVWFLNSTVDCFWRRDAESKSYRLTHFRGSKALRVAGLRWRTRSKRGWRSPAVQFGLFIFSAIFERLIGESGSQLDFLLKPSCCHLGSERLRRSAIFYCFHSGRFNCLWSIVDTNRRPVSRSQFDSNLKSSLKRTAV